MTKPSRSHDKNPKYTTGRINYCKYSADKYAWDTEFPQEIGAMLIQMYTIQVPWQSENVCTVSYRTYQGTLLSPIIDAKFT